MGSATLNHLDHPLYRLYPLSSPLSLFLLLAVVHLVIPATTTLYSLLPAGDLLVVSGDLLARALPSPLGPLTRWTFQFSPSSLFCWPLFNLSRRSSQTVQARQTSTFEPRHRLHPSCGRTAQSQGDRDRRPQAVVDVE